jgi:hypothetical protein
VGAKVWIALLLGIAGGAIGATWYFMANQPPPPDCDCPSPDVCPIPNTDGVCPANYEPDPDNPGCCMPLEG